MGVTTAKDRLHLPAHLIAFAIISSAAMLKMIWWLHNPVVFTEPSWKQALNVLNHTTAGEPLDQETCSWAQASAWDFLLFLDHVNTMTSSSNTTSWQIMWEELGYDDRPLEEAAKRVDKEAAMLHQLLCCLNNVSQYKRMTWRSALTGHLGEFKAIAAFSTTAKVLRKQKRQLIPVDDFPLTIVTTATLDRLPQLYAQCMSWPGPIAAAVYVSLYQPSVGALNQRNIMLVRRAVLQVTSFVTDIHRTPDACKLSVILLYETFQEEEAQLVMFPFNHLRNTARLLVNTALMSTMDVDLTVSKTLFNRLINVQQAKAITQQIQSRKLVLVVPCFDVRGGRERAALADALVTVDKDTFKHYYNQNITFQVAADRFYEGHGMINYSHWVHATEDYVVQYKGKAEPFVIGDRKDLPWYDPRYRGYGCDKVQFLTAINASGYQFQVMHDAYNIHRFHEPSAGRAAYMQSIRTANQASTESLYKHNVGLYRDQQSVHQLGLTFQAPLHHSTQRCAEVLS